MKSSIIKSFSVYGLFGTNDVHIKFDENVKILIGENGLGKTQILNLFYYTLTQNFFRISEFNFDKLVLTFSKGKPVEISKENIDDLVQETYRKPYVKEIISKIGFSQFEMLRNRFTSLPNKKDRYRLEEFYEERFRSTYGLPFHIIIRAIEELDMGKSKETNPFFDKCKYDIQSAIKGLDIMYFPTYRRVEEDLHSLGYDDDELSRNEESTLIQFGMDDVKKRFNKIENTIETLLKEGLSNFLKDVLKILMSKNTQIDDNIFDRINDDDLAIIFARAKNLDAEMKEAVLNSVRKKEFNDPLSGLILQKLVELYENQKGLDNSIKIFRDVCNKYLINKQVFYDESAVKIYVKSDSTNDEIQLSKLSSGEKQIISIFSKVYLSESGKRFIVLFDEPELSLSMTWQQKLLPDILNSEKCDFLLAVTHSPFIFDNELDKYAVGLNEYITGKLELFTHGS
jgi:predicted ATP-dependent endonuclease of OLD family